MTSILRQIFGPVLQCRGKNLDQYGRAMSEGVDAFVQSERVLKSRKSVQV